MKKIEKISLIQITDKSLVRIFVACFFCAGLQQYTMPNTVNSVSACLVSQQQYIRSVTTQWPLHYLICRSAGCSSAEDTAVMHTGKLTNQIYPVRGYSTVLIA